MLVEIDDTRIDVDFNQPITLVDDGVTFENKENVDIKFPNSTKVDCVFTPQDKTDYSLNASQDVDVYLEKHPEIKVVFDKVVSLGGNSNVYILQQQEYDKITKQLHSIYLIVDGDGELRKFYIGTFLIAQKNENGFFPYNFPIIF